MIWVLIAACSFAAWLSAASLILGLCRAASRGDRLGSVRASHPPSILVNGETNIFDLCAFRDARDRRCYLSSRDSRRSLSSLPSVWHVGQ
jgi:hypothetical protein